MSASELDSRNIAVSMRKSVENLVISSQDAIGQSISQALNFSGVISQHTNQIIHEAKSVSRSPSPALRADSSGTEHTDNDKNEPSLVGGSERHSNDNVSLASVADISLNVPKAASPNASCRVSEPRAAKKKSWYNALYPTYKSKSDDFKRLFKDLPDDERLIIDYSCAHQKEILVHGRLYASQNYLCFYASIFGWERSMSLRWKDVTAITKEKTALVIPNAIVVCTESEKNFLTSFSRRDKAYLMLFRIWQNALMEQPMSTQEFWQWVHSSYGEELGFNSDDEEYARELSDDTALASLPTILHIEDGAESSSMEAGGDEPRTPRTPRPHSGRDSSPPLVSNGGGDRGGRVAGAGAGDDADTLPTDMSDTSDSEHDKHNGGQSEKCISEHTDMKQFIRIQLPFNVDQLFTMLFTNSRFNLELLAIRSISNYQQTSWQEKEGLKVREVSYKLALTAGPVGPKEVHVAETQTMNKYSKPGHLYSIECSSINSGVPYADHFSVDVHYCLERVRDNATDMALYGKVTYKKSVWGMVKTFLEKNAITGIDEYARLLASRLQLEAQAHVAPHKRKGRRARLRPALLEPTVAGVPLGPALTAAGAAGGAVAPSSTPRWLLILLLILLILNAVLYWRLYKTQQAIDIDDLQSRSNNLLFDADRMSTLSGSQMSEWGSLLEAHSAKQRGQLLAWRDALDKAVSHLAQTEQAMMKLLETIKPTLEKARQDAEDQHTEL